MSYYSEGGGGGTEEAASELSVCLTGGVMASMQLRLLPGLALTCYGHFCDTWLLTCFCFHVQPAPSAGVSPSSAALAGSGSELGRAGTSSP
eukprot:1995336-Rhodomonas_salina.1